MTTRKEALEVIRLIDKIAYDSGGKTEYKMNRIWHITQRVINGEDTLTEPANLEDAANRCDVDIDGNPAVLICCGCKRVPKNCTCQQASSTTKQAVINDAGLAEAVKYLRKFRNDTLNLGYERNLETLIAHASNHDAMEDELEAVKINASHLRSLNELRNQEIAAYEIALQKKVVEKVTEQKFEKCLNQTIGEIVKRCNGFHQESVVKVIIEFMKMSKNGIKIIDGADHD